MRISRQGPCCVGLFLGMLSASAAGQPQRLSARDAEVPRHRQSAPAEVREENGVTNKRSLERRDDRTAHDSSGDGEFRIFFVPAGDDPRDYPTGPTIVDASTFRGSSLRFEIFLQYAPVPIRGAGADMPCLAAGGAGGAISYEPFSAWIDPRDDALLAHTGQIDGCAIDTSDCPNVFRFGCALNGGTLELSDPRYLGEFNLFVSHDAEGTFTLIFLDPQTAVYDEDAQPIPGLIREQLILETGCAPVPCEDTEDCICPLTVDCSVQICFISCMYIPKKFGDVNADGLVDSLDILCAIDGFAGRFDRCTFADVDISGCQADGVIDLFDILDVLDAFEGVELCNPWCGPQNGP